jgi:hypothetical protein
MILCGFRALGIFAFRVLSLCLIQNIQWWSSLLKHGLFDFYLRIFLSLSLSIYFYFLQDTPSPGGPGGEKHRCSQCCKGAIMCSHVVLIKENFYILKKSLYLTLQIKDKKIRHHFLTVTE